MMVPEALPLSYLSLPLNGGIFIRVPPHSSHLSLSFSLCSPRKAIDFSLHYLSPLSSEDAPHSAVKRAQLSQPPPAFCSVFFI